MPRQTMGIGTWRSQAKPRFRNCIKQHHLVDRLKQSRTKLAMQKHRRTYHNFADIVLFHTLRSLRLCESQLSMIRTFEVTHAR